MYWWATILYVVSCIFSSWVLGYSLRKGEAVGSTSSIFLYFTLLFYLCRIVWLPDRDAPDGTMEAIIAHVSNRVAWCLFFSALVVILLAWFSVLHMQSLSPEPKTWLAGYRCWFLGLLTPLYAMTAAEIVLFFLNQDTLEQQTFYKNYFLAFSCANFLLSFIALIVGGLVIRVSLRLQHAAAITNLRNSAAVKLTILAAFISLCFVLRAVLVGFRIWTAITIEDELFFSLTYVIPEIPPLLLQSALFGYRAHMLSRKKKKVLPKAKLTEFRRPTTSQNNHNNSGNNTVVITTTEEGGSTRRSVLTFGERELDEQLPNMGEEEKTTKLLEKDAILGRVRSSTLD